MENIYVEYHIEILLRIYLSEKNEYDKINAFTWMSKQTTYFSHRFCIKCFILIALSRIFTLFNNLLGFQNLLNFRVIYYRRSCIIHVTSYITYVFHKSRSRSIMRRLLSRIMFASSNAIPQTEVFESTCPVELTANLCKFTIILNLKSLLLRVHKMIDEGVVSCRVRFDHL